MARFLSSLLVAVSATTAIVGSRSLAQEPPVVVVSRDSATNCGNFTGAEEVPAVDTEGTGTAWLLLDDATATIHWWVWFEGLRGQPVGAHLHGPALPGETAPVVLDLADATIGQAAALTGEATVTAAQVEEIKAGRWYVNVHTTAYPDGEVRAQLMGIPVEENGVRGGPAGTALDVPVDVAAAEMADPQACALAMDNTENPGVGAAPQTPAPPR